MALPGGAFEKVTVNERLLVHLREAWVGSPAAPPTSTQEGIARALGIRENHVSRAVRTLLREGLVEQETARVRGEIRKRKVYALTSNGRSLADRLYADLLRREVLLEDAARGSALPISGAMRLPGGPFSVTQILTAMRDGSTLRTSTLRTRTPREILVFVESGLPPPEQVLGRSSEREALVSWLASSTPLLAVTGQRGMGKTTLLASFFRSASETHHALWHTLGPGDGPASLSALVGRFLERLGKSPAAAGKAPVPVVAELARRLRGQRAILVFDALGEADPAVAAWVASAAEAVAEAGAKAVLISDRSRPEWSRWHLRGLLEEIAVHGMSLEDARALVGPALPDPQLGRLHRLAGGNPLALRLAALSWKDTREGDLSESERALLGYLKVTR